MLNKLGARAVASAATPRRLSSVAVDSQLLYLLATQADTSDYTAEQIELAEATLSVIDSALEVASAEINSALPEAYVLPLSGDAPLILVQLEIALAWREMQINPTDDTLDRAKWARKYLNELATGKRSIYRESDEGVQPSVTKPTLAEGSASVMATAFT